MRGYIKDGEPFDDVWLTEDEYVEILEECEKEEGVRHDILSKNKG